jgi:hypothetical protein
MKSVIARSQSYAWFSPWAYRASGHSLHIRGQLTLHYEGETYLQRQGGQRSLVHQERTAQSIAIEVIVQSWLKAEVACSRGACGGREHA